MSEISANVPATQSRKSISFRRVLSARRALFGVLVLAVLAVIVAAALVYSSQSRDLDEARLAIAALTGQLDQATRETQTTRAELEGVRQDLSRSQADTADARASSKSLADQLAQSRQQAEQASRDAEATVNRLQAEKTDLAMALSIAQGAAKTAQDRSAKLGQKTTQALARAQLLDEYLSLQLAYFQGGKAADFEKGVNSWYRKLNTLNDPTIGKYIDELEAAMDRNPKDDRASDVFLAKVLGYLSSGIVGELKQ